MSAADANAISLSEYAMMSNDPLVKKITMSLLVNGAVLADIPFFNKKTLFANGVRWEGNLPSVTWNRLNAGTTVTKGKPSAYQEQVFLVRNAIDVDVKILEDVNRIVDPRVTQLEAYLQSLSYDFNDKFINNDHLSGDAQAPVGLRSRLDNPTTYGVATELKIDGAGVDLSTAMTAASANSFIEVLQQALDFLGSPEGDGVVLYMNDLLKRRFERAVRVLGAGAGFAMVRDAFDRSIAMYKNARIVDIGRKSDQTTKIITSTETAAGAAGSSTFTSLYAVKYGEAYFAGWQFDPLGQSINDLGLIGNDGTVSRILIDWAVGFLPQHTRCMSRIYNIKVA